MKQIRLIMGMPVTVEIRDAGVAAKTFQPVFDYFTYIDNKFSTYKADSEISLINKSGLTAYTPDMQTILKLCEETKKQTHGYFDINNGQILDPSGLVKGWAIKNASVILKNAGIKEYYVDAGGDIQVSGSWSVGIRNPFNTREIVKKLIIKDLGIATSGSYERGEHVYNPINKNFVNEIVSLTVIGPDVYEADRFATAAFAMGEKGIEFIGSLKGFSAYQIDRSGHALFTSDFDRYVVAS